MSNERESKLKALENIIVDMAWEWTSPFCKAEMRHDRTYWAERMLDAMEQVERDYEYAR